MNRSLFNWRRMVKEFFLHEINAHRCTRFNLSRGSASAMRVLRKEACDLGEASRPVGDNGKTTRLQGHQAARLRSALGDSKVTRHQIVRGGAASPPLSGARADAKRARAEPGEDKMVVGAEGACQERGAEHWQRHSCQPGAHLCFTSVQAPEPICLRFFFGF